MKVLNKSIGYSKNHNVVGAIVEISFLNETMTLMDEDGNTYGTIIDDVQILDEIGKLEGMLVYKHDVFVSVVDKSKLYEVDLHEDGLVIFHVLNEKLERVSKGTPFEKDNLHMFGTYLDFVGNKLKMEADMEALKPAINFNIAVFRNIDENDGEVTYYYVGNNAEEETVDLVKATFFGHQIFDLPYERITLSHEDFLVQVANGELKEVQPMELSNYITGTYGQEQVAQFVISTRPIEITNESEECCEVDEDCCEVDLLFDIDEDTTKISNNEVEQKLEDVCQKCGESEDECDCELWAR